MLLLSTWAFFLYKKPLPRTPKKLIAETLNLSDTQLVRPEARYQ